MSEVRGASKFFLQITAVLILILCLFVSFPLVSSAAPHAEAKTINIVIPEYPRYAYLDSDGKPAGIDVEYAYRIAENSGLRVNISIASSVSGCLSALDSGKADILFNASQTDERMKKYIFSDNALGSMPVSLYVRSDDERFSFDDISRLNGMTVATEKGSSITALFNKYCSEHNVNVKLNEYAALSDANAALASGNVDAAICGSDNVDGYKIILQFSPSQYYAMFRKNDVELRDKIDAALSKIRTEDPLYIDKLTDTYTSGTVVGMDELTVSEKAYIKSHPTVTIAVLDSDAPYYSIGADLNPKGILPDYFGKVSELTGFKFQYKMFNTQQEAINAIKNGKADFLGMYSSGLISAYNSDLLLTNPYATVNAVLLTHAGVSESSIKKIGVKDRSRTAIQADIAKGQTLVPYDNAQACFQALNRGEVDAIICGMPSATWLINQTNASAYNITAEPDINLDLCGALSYGNRDLWSIMNKAISVSKYSFNSLITNNTLAENNLRTFIARIPVVWFALLAIVLILAVIFLILSVMSLKRRHRESAVVAEAKAENEAKRLRLEAIEKNNDERNRFFSNISHDMRTPLNAIIGFSDLARKNDISPETDDYLSKIQASGNLLLDLINDTLTVSKISSGKLALHYAPYDSVELMRSIVVPIKAAADAKGVEFTVKNNAPRRTLLTDKLNGQKIMLNLLTNAVKYTPTGGHVELCIDCEEENGKKITVITVRDDGIGMSDSFLPHIYEPFAQENQTGSNSSGTGLGLSIVKQLIEMMHGTINVTSKEGEGTAFTIHICIEDAANVPEQDDETVAYPEGMLAGCKILLFEDNALNREIACAILRSWDIDVVTAENGVEGVAIFRGSSPGEFSAILMDIRMPVMDGYEATRTIRSSDSEYARTIPIIAMTADAFPDDIERCMECGMNGHISKPIDPDKAYNVLAAEIYNNKQSAQ